MRKARLRGGLERRVRVVDYFAGLGGFTLGAKRAGADVVFAINHWPEAVRLHELNHPEVAHACENLARYNPRKLPEHEILVAGPACQGHSDAAGSENRKRSTPRAPGELRAKWDDDRATAWSIVDCAEVRRPRAILVENVPKFLKWTLFEPWLESLRRLGYGVKVNVCNTALWGLAQDRDRVLVTAVHGREAPPVEPPAGVAMRCARDVIDFDDGEWTLVRDKVEATRARVARGRRAFGKRFVMPYNGSGSGLTGRSLDRPIGTVTAADRWGVVDGARMRMLTAREALLFQGFPEDYRVPEKREDWTKAIGNALAPALAESGTRALMEAI